MTDHAKAVKIAMRHTNDSAADFDLLCQAYLEAWDALYRIRWQLAGPVRTARAIVRDKQR